MIHFDVNLIEKGIIVLIDYIPKGVIDYSLTVLTQWKVRDLFKTFIVKLNLMYLKSIYIYIVSCSL